MVILGIDPGLAIIGWGVVRYDGFRFQTLGYGSIQTPAGMRTEERLARIYKIRAVSASQYRPEEHYPLGRVLAVKGDISVARAKTCYNTFGEGLYLIPRLSVGYSMYSERS